MTIAFCGPAVAASATPQSLAGDGRSFTMTFDDYRVDLGAGPMAMRWEWFVLPVSGDHGEGVDFLAWVRCAAVTSWNATANVVLTVNGVVAPGHIVPGFDGEYVRKISTGTCGFDNRLHVAVGVVVEGSEPGAAATITVRAVGAGFSS